MPSTHDDIAALREQIQLLRDRAELRELFDRYVTALDTYDGAGPEESRYAPLFTEDATFAFPIGVCAGVEAFAAFQREARERWARTHHLSTNHSVVLDGDRATLRAQQLTTHVHHAGAAGAAHFEVGGHTEARAVRTPDGWRLSHVAFHVVWDSGVRLPELAGVRL
ncbi:nuclear transport factor 2 family protein [Streptomyces sp. NBC_00091]|uniref:nuclear transport factor 2 family protein n=1 Tax=Streptomyces sp. NBC_00091 TaxID=2975648 RepID=UPI002254CC84|nr:nuclear transport factor 2 family protein [Streptomyces sp. NBC_00091]MCX5381204.1 nuclear transport factor 2 family protein [Streptomyces sp. NBC_00091]